MVGTCNRELTIARDAAKVGKGYPEGSDQIAHPWSRYEVAGLVPSTFTWWLFRVRNGAIVGRPGLRQQEVTPSS